MVTVVLGGSAQFYSYGVVNPAQRLIMDWINQTYYDRYGRVVWCVCGKCRPVEICIA